MKTISKLKEFFLKTHFPEASFFFLPEYFAGVKVNYKERKLDSYFISSLPQEILSSSFNELNIINIDYLKESFQKELGKIKNLPSTVSLLIPETSTKVFFLNFDSLPSKKEEVKELILWRVKKQIPFPEEGVRLAWQSFKSANGIKAIVSLANEKVISQYESFLSEFKLNVGVIESPIFTLFNLVQEESKGNHLLIDIEMSYLTLLGFTPSGFLIHRTKAISCIEKEEILREIDHTLKFLRDKLGVVIDSCWLRSVNPKNGLEWAKELYKVFSIPCEFIDPFSQDEVYFSNFENISFNERQILLPLLGQTLWRNLNL